MPAKRKLLVVLAIFFVGSVLAPSAFAAGGPIFATVEWVSAQIGALQSQIDGLAGETGGLKTRVESLEVQEGEDRATDQSLQAAINERPTREEMHSNITESVHSLVTPTLEAALARIDVLEGQVNDLQLRLDRIAPAPPNWDNAVPLVENRVLHLYEELTPSPLGVSGYSRVRVWGSATGTPGSGTVQVSLWFGNSGDPLTIDDGRLVINAASMSDPITLNVTGPYLNVFLKNWIGYSTSDISLINIWAELIP